MLDFRTETFLAVCRHMNYTKAAEELNITQPAVSQHIKYIEEYYGIKVFGFNGKKMFLTEEGKMLFEAISTMKHNDKFLRDTVKNLKNKGTALSFGATLTIGEYVIPEKLSAYLKKHPDSKVHLTIANTKQLLEMLDKGEIDFAVVEGYFEKNRYDHIICSQENYTALCHPCHPFAEKHMLLEELFSQTLILREEGSGTREILKRSLEEKNFGIWDFKNVIELSNINAVKTLAENGCGITFLYETAVKQELQKGTLKKIYADDLISQHEFTFIWRKNSIFSDYYKTIYENLINTAL